MSKVTSKLQVTLPKAIADRYGIKPGDEIDWAPAGDAIRVIPAKASGRLLEPAERVRLFKQSMERQRQRERGRRSAAKAAPRDRDWKREDLYTRGRAD